MGENDKIELFPSRNPWNRDEILHTKLLNFAYPFETSSKYLTRPDGSRYKVEETSQLTHDEYIAKRDKRRKELKGENHHRNATGCYYADDIWVREKFVCQTPLLWQVWLNTDLGLPLANFADFNWDEQAATGRVELGAALQFGDSNLDRIAAQLSYGTLHNPFENLPPANPSMRDGPYYRPGVFELAYTHKFLPTDLDKSSQDLSFYLSIYGTKQMLIDTPFLYPTTDVSFGAIYVYADPKARGQIAGSIAIIGAGQEYGDNYYKYENLLDLAVNPPKGEIGKVMSVPYLQLAGSAKIGIGPGDLETAIYLRWLIRREMGDPVAEARVWPAIVAKYILPVNGFFDWPTTLSAEASYTRSFGSENGYGNSSRFYGALRGWINRRQDIVFDLGAVFAEERPIGDSFKYKHTEYYPNEDHSETVVNVIETHPFERFGGWLAGLAFNYRHEIIEVDGLRVDLGANAQLIYSPSNEFPDWGFYLGGLVSIAMDVRSDPILK